MLFVDPHTLARLNQEDIEAVKRLLELTKQNEELKSNQKLAKKHIKRLKKEYYHLKQSKFECKQSCKSNNATSFSEVRIKGAICFDFFLLFFSGECTTITKLCFIIKAK